MMHTDCLYSHQYPINQTITYVLIPMLPGTTPTSIRQPKQETPHCSTYSIDYHGKQTSRTSLTDNDLVNKTNSLNISEKQFVPSVLTQSLILPNLPTLKSTVPSVASQSLSVPPPAISNIVPLATPQSLTLSHPPISNNPIPSVTSQPPYQATNVIPSNKSQREHASHPFTTTSSIPPPPLASKRPDYIESGRIKHYRKSLSESPPSPNKKSLVMKKVLSPPKVDSKINDFLYTPVTKEFHSLKINGVSKECSSNPEPQGLTFPPVSNNLIPSVTSQPPYQVVNVLSSNKSQQVHTSCPLTPNLPISSLQIRKNVDSALHHPNTNIASLPPPSFGSKILVSDFSESGRTKHYRKSSSQSLPSPNK